MDPTSETIGVASCSLVTSPFILLTAAAAWPSADPALAQDLLDLLHDAMLSSSAKKGTNESIKAVNRGVASLVILAADTVPLAIVMPLPRLCEDWNVPYVFVESKAALGRACGLESGVIAATINTDDASDLAPRVAQLRDRVERLAI
ncbi:Ribosomal protein L7Ae/L30e/S12e/Gadd45 [Penicillium macrosclerotiorum]|uniref:Ribosomal protein L7Ae/L30e/S12e/Gadd45 n=1 Tax=Penicillium macrosclerotiorum TaxID=303699 RepID=UPI0025474512|nr:Ribosomal protein L7Ae/L30e/S12e/Gadd45 [Penicillium macrosclerotiorum]KAJ5669240.1 Ribosomal protein L7Ae/L30e/S12e/Gadd45 [Penicillium macrosclerotiorum]